MNKQNELFFEPNLIINFSQLNTNIKLKDIFNCNIILIISKNIINDLIINQIKNYDVCFTNNIHIQNLLLDKYNIHIQLFYYNYSLFYGIKSKK